MNTSILYVPQDHKDFIYRFLSIRDLLNLSETCKTFHQDEKRKEVIQKKLVDSCFYSRYPLLKESLVCVFPNVMNFYFDRLKKIKFTPQSITEINEGVPFFPHCFILLPFDEKTLLVKNLIRYLGDIWNYSIDKKRIWAQWSQNTELPGLFSTFENILKLIFINDPKIRHHMLIELYSFSKGMKSSAQPRFSFNFKEDNRYTLDQFICGLGLYYWRDLKTIIEISDLLEPDYEMYLFDLLYDLFQPFIDCQYLISEKEDQYVELFEDLLDQKYDMSSGKTYKDRLLELFTSCHYMVHQEFEWAIEFRIKRLHGIDEEEDFDY
jgi:hypothetical protein